MLDRSGFNQLQGERFAVSSKQEKLEMTSKRDKMWAELTFRRTVCTYEQMETARTTSEATRKLGLTKFNEKGKLELASKQDKSSKKTIFRRTNENSRDY